MNALSCLRLTARCADILISVRREIFEAGDILEQELAAPIQKLEEYALSVNLLQPTSHHSSPRSFEGIHQFLIKLTNRPFLKRYLRRDEILRDLSDCDSSLRDALGLFGVSSEHSQRVFLMANFLYRFQFKSAYLNKFRNRRNIGRKKPRRSSRRS
jgi:hypothetical protein